MSRLVVLSVGHPATFFKAGLSQREKSWYMLLFQFRGVAEELLTRDDWHLFRELVRHHRDGRFRPSRRPRSASGAAETRT